MRFICLNGHVWNSEFTRCICPTCGLKPAVAVMQIEDGVPGMVELVKKLVDIIKDIHDENKALRSENSEMRAKLAKQTAGGGES